MSLSILGNSCYCLLPKRRAQLCAIVFSSQTLQQVLFHYGCCNNAVPKEWCSYKPIIPFHCGAVLFISHKERNTSQKKGWQKLNNSDIPRAKNMINSQLWNGKNILWMCDHHRTHSSNISNIQQGKKRRKQNSFPFLIWGTHITTVQTRF